VTSHHDWRSTFAAAPAASRSPQQPGQASSPRHLCKHLSSFRCGGAVAAMFDAFVRSATTLQRWHDGGRVWPRPL